jgi:hypothetical protein
LPRRSLIKPLVPNYKSTRDFRELLAVIAGYTDEPGRTCSMLFQVLEV